jgi:hypothetical protein
MRGIGASCSSAIPPAVDFTHFDFHFLNLLSDGPRLPASSTSIRRRWPVIALLTAPLSRGYVLR